MKGKALLIIALAIVIGIMTMGREHDKYYKKQWSLADQPGIEIENLWDTMGDTNSDRKIVVAIIDSGIDFENPEIQGLEWVNSKEIPNNGIDDDGNGYTDDVNGYSFYDGLGSEYPVNDYHGTYCAEIIAAKRNGKGIEGVVRSNVNTLIMDLKVSDSNNMGKRGSLRNVEDAILYAQEMGADICNMSFSTVYDSQRLETIMKNSNMLFTVSASNNDNIWKTNIDKKKVYPAEYKLENMICVTGIDKDGNLDKSASYGKKTVDLAAPGVDIGVVSIDGEYVCENGVSFAVAQITGIAVNLIAFNEQFSAKDIKQIICDNTLQNENLKDRCRTGGTVNAKYISYYLEKERKEKYSEK